MILLLITTFVIAVEIEGVITSNVTIFDNMLVYAWNVSEHSSPNITSQSFSSIDSIETKKVRVGDIDIAYKIFGSGKNL